MHLKQFDNDELTIICEEWHRLFRFYPVHTFQAAVDRVSLKSQYFPKPSEVNEEIQNVVARDNSEQKRLERLKLTDEEWLSRVGVMRFKRRYREVHGDLPNPEKMKALTERAVEMFGHVPE